MTPSLPRDSQLLRQATRFLASTLVGLVVDFGLFALAVHLGLQPGPANAISSACAVVVMYVLSTRVTFGTRAGLTGFLLFAGWYAVSITGFSFVVQALHTQLDLAPVVSKVATLPFSFVANFLAVRLLLGSLAARGTDRAASPSQESQRG